MSVIVFNTHENAMYADTITSLSSGCAYDGHKVAFHEFDNGWKLLLGKIGVPAYYDPVEQYVLSLLSIYAAEEVLEIKDFNGRKILPMEPRLQEHHLGMMDAFNKHLDGEGDFSFLIALTDGTDTALGVMHNTLGITWGVSPLNRRRDFVLGSPMVTSAYNSVPEFNLAEEVPTYKKLEQINNIQFLGVAENNYIRYTFDGHYSKVMLWENSRDQP